MKEKNIYIVVTSVIYFANAKLSYSDKRSNYNPETRISQTIETINSIKKYIPNAKIILVESGLNKDIGSQIIDNVYKYIYIGDNKMVRMAVDSKRKGFGETIGLLFGIPKEEIKNSIYMKFSGRYRVNEEFEISRFAKKGFTFLSKDKHYSTRCYAVSGGYYYIWKMFLILSLPFLLLNISIEKILYILIPNLLVNNTDKLGIEGEIGTDGHKICE